MRMRPHLLLALSLGFVVACVKDQDTADELGEENSAESNDSDTTTDTGGEPIACGEIECAANQACLTFPQSPMCTDKPEDQPCPPGTTETYCGGAGLPCCCEPPPAPVTECVDPVCEGQVDCDCLAEVCIPTCTPSATSGVFICEEPARP
jgi:hypothetical protein